MSSYFNQTNIAPGTSFSGSGGGGLNPTFASITAANNPTNYINMSDTNGNLRVATGLSSLVVSFNAPTDTRAEINPVGGVKLGFFNSSGGVNPGGYWAFGNNSGVANEWGMGISSISSIAGNGSAATGTVNMNALISTLKVAYPGCIS